MGNQRTRHRPRGASGPTPKDKVFSVESAFGGVAIVRAASAEALKQTLDAAKAAGEFALLTRVDGEPLLLASEFVFLVGEPMASTVQPS